MYSPKIKPDLVERLYHISKDKGKPMTHVVNEIIENGVTKIEEKQATYKEGR